MIYQILYDELIKSERANSYKKYVVTNDMPKENAFEKDSILVDMLNTPIGDRVVEYFVSEVELMAVLGVEIANSILDKIEAASELIKPLQRAIRALRSTSGIDLGHAQTRSMLDSLVPSLLTIEEVVILKSLAEQPSSIAYEIIGRPATYADVSIALRGNFEFTPE